MPSIIWTPQALRDLSRLRSFLQSKDPYAARRAVSTIRQGANILRDQPELGHSADGLPKQYRERFIPFGNSGYLILYRFESNRVLIAALRHSRELGYK